jgi:hypothetical protein
MTTTAAKKVTAAEGLAAAGVEPIAGVPWQDVVKATPAERIKLATDSRIFSQFLNAQTVIAVEYAHLKSFA